MTELRHGLIRDLSKKAADDVDYAITRALRLAYHDEPDVALSITISGAIAALDRVWHAFPDAEFTRILDRQKLYLVAAALAARTSRGEIVLMHDLADVLFSLSKALAQPMTRGMAK